MRPIDADALEKTAIPCEIHNGALTELCVPLYQIRNAPTVEERPTGKWIIVKNEKYGDNVKCPFCGKEVAGSDLNFCVNCGAKMKGEEE